MHVIPAKHIGDLVAGLAAFGTIDRTFFGGVEDIVEGSGGGPGAAGGGPRARRVCRRGVACEAGDADVSAARCRG